MIRFYLSQEPILDNDKTVIEIVKEGMIESVEVLEKDIDSALDQQIESLIIQAGGKEGAERALGQSIKDFRREFWYEMQNR